MTRICIICEGPTEVGFVNSCLSPYLRNTSGREAYGTVLIGKSGRSRGGSITVDRLATCMAQNYHQADRVTTLVDFYGFQERKGRNRAQLEHAIADAAGRLIGERCNLSHLLPYVQMHEFEGLLFTDPGCFAVVVDGWSPKVLTQLEQVAQDFQNPEDINNSPMTAPSKRILKIFNGAYSKPEHGPLIAEKIGIDAIRKKCPAFNDWVGKLQLW